MYQRFYGIHSLLHFDFLILSQLPRGIMLFCFGDSIVPITPNYFVLAYFRKDAECLMKIDYFLLDDKLIIDVEITMVI